MEIRLEEGVKYFGTRQATSGLDFFTVQMFLVHGLNLATSYLLIDTIQDLAFLERANP